ncbi:MAG: V-type ATPase subunit, partial [Candidatus Aureabacteria bacterium]|nr:V-type ATPase subunit [Candidatus Auribacterota bacterium]
SQQLFPLETAIETDYYRRLQQAVEALGSSDCAVASRMIGSEIDIRNIEILLRLLRYSTMPAGELAEVLLPGGLHLNQRLLLSAYASRQTGELLDVLRILPRSLTASRPKEAAGQLEFLKAVLEEVVAGEARRALSGFPFSIGTVIAYFILARSESRRLRRILVGKYLGVPGNRLARTTAIGN